ncbi:MAG: DUF308 domain-containing protein [Lachnospira sp.]|nr:DUF308 domain-containing protein [Lachnospira sp.]
MDEIVKKIKGIKRELIIVSLALIALGILMVIFPEVSGVLLCKGIGIALCVWGVLRLISYYKIMKNEVLGSFGLVQGVCLAGFGVFFVMKPEVIAVFITTALAIIIIVDGVLKLQYAVDFHNMQVSTWWIELVAAVIMVILGVVALMNPFSTISTLMIFMGIVFVFEGIWDLVAIIRIASAAKSFRQMM